MNFCPKCGNSIGANDKFCPVCGEKLQNDQPGEVEVKPVSSNEPHQYQYQASGVDTREDKKKKDNGTISLVCGILALGSIVFPGFLLLESSDWFYLLFQSYSATKLRVLAMERLEEFLEL